MFVESYYNIVSKLILEYYVEIGKKTFNKGLNVGAVLNRNRQLEPERDARRRRPSRDELESEVISLGDNSDEMIDLTGDLSDTKGMCF